MTSLRPPPLSLLNKYRGREPQTVYSTTVTVTGGAAAHGRASGIARSNDGSLDVELRLPPELGGPGNGPNPEQLFAASYAACFHGALSLLAAKVGVVIDGATVSASVDFCRDPMDGLFMLNANIRVHLPGVERSIAEELVRNTERFSPYTKMAREGINHVVALAPSDDKSKV
ncbi:peroxiredoxin [Burkholderia sp. HI2714]|uniref:Ohr family peroxiredoxin n=1 Tax=Burkholderia sp. HI2714 TaxID=2015359 RepID=UPI000B7AAE7C|nr:Ohr family peroxiredoxin [Burkholderia sp. HI2714]OXJ22533.1 peroxiredoxin [Burkholderia sp. HI2714]